MRIMVACTANICRSVMAEHYLRRALAERGIAATVESCGILFDGEPASPVVVDLLAEEALDASGHRSRRFEPSLLDGVDLVVTMERMHAREFAMAAAGTSARIHTLGALAGFLTTPPDGALPDGPLDRIAAAAAVRATGDLLGHGADEVDDPHGRSRKVHRQAAERIRGLVDDLVAGLWGPA